MLFNSLQFLIFFAVLFVTYYSIPGKYGWWLLLAGSFYFYMSFVPSFVLILLSLIVMNYFLGLGIYGSSNRRKKTLFVLGIVANVGMLFFFKYFNFFNENAALLAQAIHWNYPMIILQIALPVGLSFHIFQSLSYIIEIYRGRQNPERNIGIYGLYVSFFPKLIAGPIERPQNLIHQFREVHFFDALRVRRGLELIIWGFFKKIVIADKVALLVNHVYGNLTDSSGLAIFLAAVLFSYQLYCDFSGYSDIAVGSALVFGYDITQNFNRPYAARSITEFWQRWHISLSRWLKDYLYYPLVFARKKISKLWLYSSLFVTFFLIGLWHGANWTYVIFGSMHGFYMVFGSWTVNLRNKISKITGLENHGHINKAWQTIVVFLLVTASLVFFRASDVHDALYALGKIFSSFWDARTWFSDLGISLRSASVIVSAIIFLECVQYAQAKFGTPFIFEARNRLFRFGWYYALIFGILTLGHFGAEEFIYFKF